MVSRPAQPPGAFRLRRYFSIASGIAILLVTLLLTVTFYLHEVDQEVEAAQARNVTIAQTFANAIWPQFSAHLTSDFPDAAALRADPATARLDATLRAMTRGVPVIKIKIYDPGGRAMYSSVAGEIGEDRSANPGFGKARAGIATSELTHRGSLSATEGRVENVDVVSTYIPIRHADQRTEAVFELYSDVTEALAGIEHTTVRLVATLVAVFAVLYGVLLFVVARADAILQRQYSALRESERAMQEKNRELDAANRAKSEFLSSTSHELRTPMNAILGFAQLLESEPGAPLDANQRRFVQQILKAGRHLLELINEVLDLARIEAGRMTLSIEPVALASVLQECLPLVQNMALEKSIEVSVADPGGVRVLADYMRLKQALLNFLSNAVKYNREGGTVALAFGPGAPGRIRISVADTGTGIERSQQGKLFQPFQRLGADPSLVEGTGIGLALTRDLVLAMGGDIGFASEAGRGSTFWIELPEAAAEPARVARVAPEVHPPVSAPDGRLLLYVEDNPANIQLMQQIARRMSLRFLCAHTGELGVALAATSRPDLVVMDLNLPGMDGYDALSALRANPATAAIPVMALTASAMDKEVARGLEAGFTRYLTKPFDVDRMIESIGELMGQGA